MRPACTHAHPPHTPLHLLQVPIDIAEWSATLALLLAVGLYVLDVTYWPSRRARRAAAGVLGFFLLLAALFAADKKPSLPIGLCPSWLETSKTCTRAAVAPLRPACNRPTS